MTELPGLGGTFSTGRDINQVGVIVGQSNDASDLGRPVVWTNGSIALLSDDGLGGIAQGINDHGDVVGWIKGADGFNHAVMWNSDGRTDLGNLGGGNSFAYAINNQGVVVGNSDNWPTDAGPYAFVWQDGTLHALAALVPAGLGGLSSLRVAHALNDAGQITGWAVNQAGDHEAFVVNPGHIQLFGLDVAVAGEGQRNIKVAQAAPGATVIAYYSTHSGLSSHHGVDLGLARARPFRATTVGPLGTAWLGAIFVPPSASGAMVWVQGIELPRTEMPQVTNLQALRFR